jgi:hypothetical protein
MADLTWLNAAVSFVPRDWDIFVLTYRSPMLDVRANDARYVEAAASVEFRTDLSAEACWVDERVQLWAFGRTHFTCWFLDERGKVVGMEGEKRMLWLLRWGRKGSGGCLLGTRRVE